MAHARWFKIAATFAFLLIGWSGSLRAADTTAADEFTIKQQYMRERVHDFYTRQENLDRQDREREADSGEMHKQRIAQDKVDEKAREEFVRERKAKPYEDPTKFEKELADRKKAYEAGRKDFVLRRDIYRKQEKSFDTIPPEEELGIAPDDTN
jgi:Mg-chelatase subunit ChlI